VLTLRRKSIVPGLHAIEPAVVVVSQDGTGTRYVGSVAEHTHFEGAGLCQFACTPEGVLPIGGESWTGDGAPGLRIAYPLRELFQQSLAASSV
jgi:hypothetical protein